MLSLGVTTKVELSSQESAIVDQVNFYSKMPWVCLGKIMLTMH